MWVSHLVLRAPVSEVVGVAQDDSAVEVPELLRQDPLQSALRDAQRRGFCTMWVHILLHLTSLIT